MHTLIKDTMTVLDLYLPHDELRQRVVRRNVYCTFK
jgi:hypothetical protein